MSFVFKKATRENIPLIIGLSGGTGSGKTYTALELGVGLAMGKPMCVIDTESGRAKHYADDFEFDHGDLAPPFKPDRYEQAIVAADNAGYRVVVVDSMSHEWAGEGGILDWQEDEVEKLSKGNPDRYEAVKMRAWIKPKMAHKHMVQRLLQLRCHLILCFRAEPKVEMVKDSNGKWQIVPMNTRTGFDGWVPICEKNLPFELTMSFLLMNDRPGLPNPIKLEKQHRGLIDLSKPLSRDVGTRLAGWAQGAKPAGAGARRPQTPEEWKSAIHKCESLKDLEKVSNALANAFPNALDVEVEDALIIRKEILGEREGKAAS